MKRYFYLLPLLTLFVFGCRQESSILSSDSVGRTETGMKKTIINFPKPENSLSTEMIFSKSQIINGNSGGEIIIDRNYYGGPHGQVKVIAKIKFSPRSFSGTKNITMTIDDVEGIITFSPSMYFNKPAELYLKFEGMDIYGIDPNQVSFYYIDDNGLFYPEGPSLSYKEIQVDVPNGILELKEGLIPHFSRYCWGR